MNVRLLFLGCGESSRCRLAAALTRPLAGAGAEIACATIDPDAGSSRSDDGLAALTPALVSEPCPAVTALGAREFDLVVVCGRGEGGPLPMFPGRPTVVVWPLPDPATFEAGDTARFQAQCTDLRDRLQHLVSDLFVQGYLEAILRLRANGALILDAISDGVMAHDLQRRIVFFNRAAEVITGRRREDVLGHDCHDVFACGFCGGKCTLEHAGTEPGFEEKRARLETVTTQGERRTVEAQLRPLRDCDERWIGLVVAFHDMTREARLERRVEALHSFAGIIGRDAKMLEVFDLMRDVADSMVPILVQGESGTGKELVAAAIHNEGPRASKPFVAVNCGALPEGLLESELFGHVKGSFTGAFRDKKGRFEMADGGTIFLDEIGDVSPAMQVRLLRVLQAGVIQRVGSETAMHVDVRIISATHRNLQQEIAAGRFREDLYYRLNVVPIWLPPLRERLHDIPLLVEHLLARFLAEMGRTGAVQVSPEAMDVLLSYDWPGNVRELQNWLQYALVKCRSALIRPEHLPPPRLALQRQTFPGGGAVAGHATEATPTSLTVARVREVLEQTHGHRGRAAQVLGVSRATLYRFFDAHPEAAG